MKNMQRNNNLCGSEEKGQTFGFINWFLPLYFILAQYTFIVNNIGTVILIFSALYHYVRYNRKLKIHKWLALFIGYCSLMQLFHTINEFSVTAINNLVMPILFLIIISVFIDDVNEENLYKAYSRIGMVVMSAMFYQSIGYYIWGMPAIPINILPVGADKVYLWGDFLGARPSSFFAEPQAYASYMMPLLFFAFKRITKTQRISNRDVF
jgi:hypothetical protein